MKKALLLLAAILVIILIIVWADTGNMPWFIAALYDFPNGDKVGHFFLMGGFAVIVNLILIKPRSLSIWKKAILVNLLISFSVLLEELSQRFFSTRTSSILDLTSSLLGIWLLGFSAIGIRERLFILKHKE